MSKKEYNEREAAIELLNRVKTRLQERAAQEPQPEKVQVKEEKLEKASSEDKAISPSKEPLKLRKFLEDVTMRKSEKLKKAGSK